MYSQKKYKFCNTTNKNCDVSMWCVCEAVERIEHIIEDDVVDLIGKDKEFYFQKVKEKLEKFKWM